MTTAQLRNRAKMRVDALPAEKVKVAADFLAYLLTAAGAETAEKLARTAKFERQLAQAEREVAEGHATPVERLRRK